MSLDPAVARALEIGPDSSPAEHTVEITTRGAQSGHPRRIEVWLHRIDGHWYLTGVPGPRGWYANLRAHPQFVVHLKHGVTADLPATALPIVDQPTRQRVLAEVLKAQDRPQTAGRVPRQYLDDWLAGSPLVEILFDDEEPRPRSATPPE